MFDLTNVARRLLLKERRREWTARAARGMAKADAFAREESPRRALTLWRGGVGLLAAFFLCAPPSSGQPPSADRPAGPRLEVLWAAGSPVSLSSPSLGTERGLPFVECTFANTGNDVVWQVESLFLVYDAAGVRKAVHALGLADADLPIASRASRTARIPLPNVDIDEDDTVRIGLTRVGTEAAPDAWTNERLGEESDAQMQALFAPPPLIVSAAEGAPVTIGDVVVQADMDGNVIGLSLRATNDGDKPVLGFVVVAHVLDADGQLRESARETIGPARALPPHSSYPVRLRIAAQGLRRATVWVALESVQAPAWKNVDTPGQARAAMQQRRRARTPAAPVGLP